MILEREAGLKGWPEIRTWRRARRTELVARRVALPAEERKRANALLRSRIWQEFPELAQGTVGFYWPFKGELDFRPLVTDLVEHGAAAALPVVVEKQRPLEFWAWRPRMKLGRGIWDIPIPATREVVQPTALIVPLIGFDAAGYRLGYGGGYYDRTLAVMMSPRPFTVGVGLELGRLATIHPQPHDIPLDAIVTEAGSWRFRRRGEPAESAAIRHREAKLDEALKQTFPASDPLGISDDGETTYAAPPCFLREVDPAYLGYLTRVETIVLLNRLLEAERAGARGVAEMARQDTGMPASGVLSGIARDEARFCAMLSRHVMALGGVPSALTGQFYETLLAGKTTGARVDLLNRGQGWVVRKLREALPRIGDDVLRADLAQMLEIHERNIRHCRDLTGLDEGTRLTGGSGRDQ